jgi:hypothetical protein
MCSIHINHCNTLFCKNNNKYYTTPFLTCHCHTEKVLERGERIELLVDKTENLNQNAFKFKKASTQLKRSMWWKNIKIMIILALVIIVRTPFFPSFSPTLFFLAPLLSSVFLSFSPSSFSPPSLLPLSFPFLLYVLSCLLGDRTATSIRRVV